MEAYDGLATELVLSTGYALVFPEYRLSPEAKWPEQQDQCFAVLEWLTKHGACHNLVTDKFAMIGDSAGGKSRVTLPFQDSLCLFYIEAFLYFTSLCLSTD